MLGRSAPFFVYISNMRASASWRKRYSENVRRLRRAGEEARGESTRRLRRGGSGGCGRQWQAAAEPRTTQYTDGGTGDAPGC